MAGGGYSLLSLNLPQVFWALVLGCAPSLYDIAGFDAELHQVTAITIVIVIAIVIIIVIVIVIMMCGI